MVARTLILAALIALAACQTTGGSTFCDISKPIRLTEAQIEQLTDAQVKELLAHNERGRRLCGWKP